MRILNPAVTQLESEPNAAQSAAVPEPVTVESLLAEQQSLTAVERFSLLHESALDHETDVLDRRRQLYQELIPLNKPGNGQQYAFEVDLNACSGCKACVSACHHLNGLEHSETWRWVGQIYGTGQRGNQELPVVQHVTTACHHCVEPACLAGCPTNAYEKDPETGIVRHLDDQCFGCQYCTMSCPYEVPQFDVAKGIVRKCDMCHGRLAEGEAPACAQACPNQAIRIRVVDTDEAIEKGNADQFLPCTPDAAITKPTTVYKHQETINTGATSADQAFAKPQHAHLPLVVMLVLTQLGVGGIVATAMLRWSGLLPSQWQVAVAYAASLAGLLVGLSVAPLHLGRPHLAFRAVLGWRHSWLSREAAVFGLIPPLAIGAILFAARPWVDQWTTDWLGMTLPLPPFLRIPVELLAAVTGIAGVFCSARIYQVCRRELWKGPRTGLKFALTSAVLGTATIAASLSVLASEMTVALVISLLGLTLFSAVQLLYEATLLQTSLEKSPSLRLTRKLLVRDLRGITLARFSLGIVGGMLLPIAALTLLAVFGPNAIGTTVVFAALVSATLGELAARYLYFAAVIPLRMPGGIA